MAKRPSADTGRYGNPVRLPRTRPGQGGLQQMMGYGKQMGQQQMGQALTLAGGPGGGGAPPQWATPTPLQPTMPPVPKDGPPDDPRPVKPGGALWATGSKGSDWLIEKNAWDRRQRARIKAYEASKPTAADQTMADFQNAMNQWNQFQWDRQQELLGGHQGRIDLAQASFANRGQQQQLDIARQFKDLGSKQQQNLATSGLGGTTIGASLSQGRARDEAEAQARSSSQYADLEANVMAGLRGDKLGAMERLDIQGPNWEMLMQLMAGLGEGGIRPAGGFAPPPWYPPAGQSGGPGGAIPGGGVPPWQGGPGGLQTTVKTMTPQTGPGQLRPPGFPNPTGPMRPNPTGPLLNPPPRPGGRVRPPMYR